MAALLLPLLLPHPAQADAASFLRGMIKSRLNLEIRVVGERGQPLPGAVVWRAETDPVRAGNESVDLAAAQRFARRYGKLADFVSDHDLPGFVLHRTNPQGVFRDQREYTSYHPSGGYAYLLILSHRGYLPVVREEIAPLNQPYTLEIRLQPDPLAPPDDPDLQRFDDIMAQARSLEPGEDVMGEARMRRLQGLEQALRTLAAAQETAGKHDAASAMYWALADFPQVISTTSSDGSIRIVGYANGRNSPAATADRLKATQLNQSFPKLLISQAMLAQGYPAQGITTPEQGHAFLAAFRAQQQGPLTEQLTPSLRTTAFHQEIRFGSPESACAQLQDNYRFEPASMSRKDWHARIAQVSRKQQETGQAPSGCPLQGLTPLAAAGGRD